MDPRNFLNEVRIFQFEQLTYDPNINFQEGVEKILYGTEFYKRNVEYKRANGEVVKTDLTYSDLIWNAAQYSGVGPYLLASRIKQEVGPFLSHNSISGTVAGYEGLYNFYNIGATSSTEPMGAIKNGLQYARDGKGLSEAEKANLFIPWDTPEKAIKGGAVFLGRSYISIGQSNLYLQKFDVIDETGGGLFWHQYMTNCLAPYSESSSIYKAYSSNSMLSSAIGFLIPVYENMPQYPADSPNIDLSQYISDDTNVYADVSTVLNVRSGPGTSYEIVTSINRNTKMTRIAKGNQDGERWDKVILDNGIIGYVFQNYIKEVPKAEITNIKLSIDNNILIKGTTDSIKVEVLPLEASKDDIVWYSSNEDVVSVEKGVITAISNGSAIIKASTPNGNISDEIEITVYTPVTDIVISKENMSLNVGEKGNILVNVFPEYASNKNVVWESSNLNIATVDKDGNVTAIAEGVADIIVKTEDGKIEKKCTLNVKNLNEDVLIEFDSSLKINGDEISGLNINNLDCSSVKQLINTNLNIEIYNYKDNLLTDDELVGTGAKLVLKDEDNNEICKFVFLVYGDVNGDGLINSLDVLVIQKHILETKLITGIFVKTGNISKNGNLPNSLDVLKIQKHILEIKMIEQ